MNCRWYKEAIIYSLDVDTFKDANGDGIGDFSGLTQSLRYLSGLGVNCVWLLPFYPSPNRDNGYDVTDYYNVDPRLGTLGDFVEFMDEAGKRKLRVMVDLVLNHTSNEHPWFKEACRSRSSPFHDYYVWRYDEPPDTSAEAIFPPEQEGVWSYIEAVNGWYLHRFYSHQPDLNVGNPKVRAEMKRIIAFWLKLGVSGFRVDAVPFLVEMRDIQGEKAEHTFDFTFLREFREFLTWTQGDAVMLAEANVDRDEQLVYFGADDRMHMVFNFLVNQQIFLSLARNSAEPLREGLRQMPRIPPHCQWGMFLRNHDELSLDRLASKERELCFAQFAPEERMRIFGRGIRRRLAPILGGDRRKILLAYSLLLSLPGTPVLWYGEEIGMGDRLDLPGRFSVRTPMHWSSGRNAGFSTAPGERLIRPVISGGEYSHERINVETEQRDANSLLCALQQMIRARLHHPEFGCCDFRLLELKDSSVLGHRCQWEGQSIVALHNFSGEQRPCSIHLEDVQNGNASDALGGGERKISQGTFEIDLEPFGYRWIRIRKG
jgi:maltose alpha-D-glucosyltransferase/alpha-amylase